MRITLLLSSDNEELGCPKSTFYKILNNLKKDENLFDHIKDDSIWDYTS